MKKRKIAVIFIIIFISISIICFLLFSLISVIPYSSFDSSPITRNSLYWDSSLNLNQGLNECGAYSCMAFTYSSRNTFKDPKIIYRSINNKLKNGMILPWEMSKYLNKNGYKTKTKLLFLLNNENKLYYLSSKINEKKPVILLIKYHNVFHYITIIGEDTDSFFCFDSMQETEDGINTIDNNGDDFGNISISKLKLISIWNGATIKNQIINLCICE